jgi:hypothetical protein
MKDRRTTPSWDLALEAEEVETDKDQALCGWPGCTRPRAPAPSTGRPREYCEMADEGEYPHDSTRAAAARKRACSEMVLADAPGTYVEAHQEVQDLAGRLLEALSRFDGGIDRAADADRHRLALATTEAECRRRIAEAETDLATVHALLAAADGRAAAADEEVAALRAEAAALRAEVEEERGTVARLRDEVSRRGESIATLEVERDEARDALERTRADLATSAAHAGVLEREVELLTEARDDARKERDLARRDRARRERELRTLQEEVDGYRARTSGSPACGSRREVTEGGSESGTAAA